MNKNNNQKPPQIEPKIQKKRGRKPLSVIKSLNHLNIK